MSPKTHKLYYLAADAVCTILAVLVAFDVRGIGTWLLSHPTLLLAGALWVVSEFYMQNWRGVPILNPGTTRESVEED